MNQFCENCGNQLKNGEKFCEKCGTQVPVVTKQNTSTGKKVGRFFIVYGICFGVGILSFLIATIIALILNLNGAEELDATAKFFRYGVLPIVQIGLPIICCGFGWIPALLVALFKK